MCPYLGEALRLVPEPGRTRAHRRGDVLLVVPGGDPRPALERWYRRAARVEIAPRVERAAARRRRELRAPERSAASARAGARARRAGR